MKVRKIIWIACSSLLIAGCSQKEKEVGTEIDKSRISEIRKDLVSGKTKRENLLDLFKEANGNLTESKIIEDFEFKLTYKPHLVMIIQDKDSIPDIETIKSEALQYENLHYMTLSIKNKTWNSELLKFNAGSPEEYSERINYYSFRCQNDLYFIEDKDTLKGAFVNFERAFDISPVLNITIAFERKRKGPYHDLSFVYDDKIFNNGKIKFELNSELISMFNSPEITRYKL